ncbi:glycosyltransferase family 2 protein [Flavobacterium sp. Sr18]|uniref:glycosyltransferase family 2 protein n=1 Tax=Flavobacterium sp. Sr18 TaxID=935222 RepID=UPI0013E4DBF5|nr:glycosyltransferase family 2 protein [Flavobacterium sp. Sr18]QIH39498.1 glycosyltransferase family 2 protein [Flavobacterium sp. Sr18]
MESLVYILLASYNGAQYIEKQLDSIIAQTHTNWRLLIRDDGSTDSTLSIIKKYVNIDNRIKIIDEDKAVKGNGACQNFAHLMEAAVAQDASFIQFSDQDDYWFSNKIELLLSTIINSKSSMVYSDFLYADEKLNELPASVQKAKSSFAFPSFKNGIVQNHVYGCTMMIDGILAKTCMPIPEVAENHDYWIALVASGIGAKIHHLEKPLMLYRQHSNNVTGSFKDHYILSRIERFLFRFTILRKNELKKINMLKGLDEQLNKKLMVTNKSLLDGFFNALKKGNISIVLYCIKNKIKRHSFMSTIIYFITLCNLPKTQKK